MILNHPQKVLLESDRIGFTRGPMDLGLVPDPLPGQSWAYQGGILFQVGPKDVMLSVAMRLCGTRIVDLEAGSELMLLDTIGPVKCRQRIRLSETEEILHPRTGERIYMSAGFTQGGFVPLGALRADGSPHPHAGTGFSFIADSGYPVALEHAENTIIDGKTTDVYTRITLRQLAFGPRGIEITHEEMMQDSDLLPDGFKCIGLSFAAAIPDGDDLLLGVNCGSFAKFQSGFTRWRRLDGRWRLVDFRLVDPFGCEPTIVRDPLDGSLLMCVRPSLSGSPTPISPALHKSRDGGLTWHEVYRKPILTGNTPVILNRALDGTLYMATNQHHKPLVHRLAKRNMIWAYPLTDDRTDHLTPVLMRDGPAEFGPTPTPNSTWRLDHPIGSNVRLSDGKWRHLVTYRVLDDAEMHTNAGASPMTGTYIEEVTTPGPIQPTWRFE